MKTTSTKDTKTIKSLFGKNFAEVMAILIIALLITNCKKDSDDPNIPSVVNVRPVAWAVGNQDSMNHASIFYTADTGSTWVRQGANSNALLNFDAMNLFVVDTNNVWVVGSNRSIVRTTDGGDTWTGVNPPDVGADIAIQCISIVNQTEIWISGGTSTSGVVCRSDDGGETWAVMDSDLIKDYMMQGILAINSNLIYAVGSNSTSATGIICRTLDSGISWDSIQLADNYSKGVFWIGVAATDDNHVVIYGQENHYAFTTDGGISWTNDSVASGSVGTADINHLIMLDDQVWWAAMDMGTIMMTTDGGQSWNNQRSVGAGSMYLMGIDAYNENIAIVTGQSLNWPVSGEILQTKDGGNNWVSRKTTDFWMLKVAFAPH